MKFSPHQSLLQMTLTIDYEPFFLQNTHPPLSTNLYLVAPKKCCEWLTDQSKVRGSWGRRLLAVAGEVTRHGRAHPYSWSITIVSLKSKESEECHRRKWETEFLSMFLAVTCQHVSGACQSHSRPVLNLCGAWWKYVELSPSTPPFLTLQFYKRSDTNSESTPNLRPILPLLGHI
jgi:hypothetical protein